LDSANLKAAKTIIAFLTQRSGKGKAVKNTNEAGYLTQTSLQCFVGLNGQLRAYS
jgi:hypothetical protein